MTLKRNTLIAFITAILFGQTDSSLLAAPATDSGAAKLTVRNLDKSGPFEIVDGDQPVLRYNYQLVTEPSELKGRIKDRTHAVARSDYIHPLYGLHGEVLTEDWAVDHPHHRGIYWAWPEVDWQGKRGDPHALQKIFAKPTGKISIQIGPDFAQITAENEWLWDHTTPIVREEATICVRRQAGPGRCIDLQFRFTAINADVQVARRGQSHYGGLNLRLAPVKDQQITTFTDPPTASPRRAWADRTGTPLGGQSMVGLSILQSPLNPDYPGDWLPIPKISWVQPTFPASGTRYTITKDRPLELRYRLWVHDGKLEPQTLNDLWTAYRASLP